MNAIIQKIILISIIIFNSTYFANAQEYDTEQYNEGVKKIAITLLGRLPNEDENKYLNEHTEKKTAFEKNFAFVIDYFMQSNSFFKHMEQQLREEYLEGVPNKDIIVYITDFYQLDKGRTTSIYYDYFHRHYIQLFKLGQLLKGKYPDSLTIRYIQRLMVDNHVYDQINMGIDNTVLSLFQHFMMRKPTHYELIEGKKMVEGKPGILFNQYGKSKNDFLDILFTSNNYYEGQVRYWYIKIMHEEPDTDAILDYMPVMREFGSPENLIKRLLLKKTSAL